MTTEQLIAQLGMSAVFAIGFAIIANKYWAHYEGEITWLRNQMTTLQAELIEVKKQLLNARLPPHS